MKYLFIFLVLSFFICNGQTIIVHKGIHIYSTTKNENAHLDNGLELIKKTLDTIISMHQVFDSRLREPEANFIDNPKYIDRNVFNNLTTLSQFPFYYSMMDHDVENFEGIQVLVVKYPSINEANNEKKVILRHFNQYGYDVFTSYISCTVHGNYLRFITISGDDSLFSPELLTVLKFIHN